MAKYRKKLAALELAKKWWDKQPQAYKNSTTRPESIKQQIIGLSNVK